MNLGANVAHVRHYMGWERIEFTYRFAPATLDNDDRKRCYDNLRSLEVRKQHTSELVNWLEPVLRINADILQPDDLTRLTPDALVALRGRYTGPPMDALTLVVNRYCDGVEPTQEECQSALIQADEIGKREKVLALLRKIAIERKKWHRKGTLQRVNHWKHA